MNKSDLRIKNCILDHKVFSSFNRLAGYHETCSNCGANPTNWVYDISDRICANCGNAVLDNVTDKVSDEEYYRNYKPKYHELPYMRSRNFRKLMRQTLGRQRVIIPKDLITSIEAQILYPDRDEVRRVLKSMGLQKKYYKHVNLIVAIIDKVDVKLPNWVEQALESLYCQYEHNFDEIKENKKKFPPFNYLNRKGLELLEKKYDADLHHLYYLFPDVKQKRTRIRNDAMFEKLVARIGHTPLRY